MINLQGSINLQDVITLINPGAGCGFLGMKLMKELQLPVNKLRQYNIFLG